MSRRSRPSSLATAILGLIDDPEERRRMAEAARNYAVSQSWDAIMGGLRDRYQAVIDQATGPRPTSRAGSGTQVP